jgi:hypothetical protein
VLIEGVVIVASILLAFWIDAWWDDRLEDHREREQLASMRTEFESSLSGIDSILASLEGHAKNIESLIELLKAAGEDPVPVPGPLLGSAITWRTSDVSTSTLDALMASGDLNLLENADLRAKLAGLPAVLRDLTEDENMSMHFAETEMSTFLAREGLAEIAYAYRQGVQNPETGITNLSAPTEIIVVSSPELIGLLTARRVHFWFSLNGLPRVRSYLQMLIEEIDDELKRDN